MGLSHRSRQQDIRPGNFRENGTRKPLGEFLRPLQISRENTIAVPNSGRHDPIACHESRMEPAGNAKTNDAAYSGAQCPMQCRAEATTLAANHGYPITTRNYGFARERGHSNNMSWHPAPWTSELAQLPTRQQRPRYFCACSQPAESYIGVLGIH